jgi:hypothetical protein
MPRTGTDTHLIAATLAAALLNGEVFGLQSPERPAGCGGGAGGGRHLFRRSGQARRRRSQSLVRRALRCVLDGGD